MNIQYIDLELSKKNIDHEKFIVGKYLAAGETIFFSSIRKIFLVLVIYFSIYAIYVL